MAWLYLFVLLVFFVMSIGLVEWLERLRRMR